VKQVVVRGHLAPIAYGSERGGTAEIAQWIGDELRDAGLSADVRRGLVRFAAWILHGAEQPETFAPVEDL
jgi:hypothetical protein